jgi:hypothetical protein
MNRHALFYTQGNGRNPDGSGVWRLCSDRFWISGVVVLCLVLCGCDLFRARTPEDPEGDAGTWLQPDTPERVIENVQNAISELNTQNYLRSLSDDFEFVPTLEAESREPVFSGWSRAEEETYFTRLRAAAEPFPGRELQLFDRSPSIIGSDRYVLNATYQLKVQHSRVDESVPSEVQGRLVWEISQSADGLWQLYRWTDQTLGTHPSWSDLKAAFVK